MGNKIRIVIADDHTMVRNGLQMFIDSIESFELVGQASDGDEAIRICRETDPDVVLMDLAMPKVDGVEAIRGILHSHPHIKIIALTSFKDDDLVYAALKMGAVNYLLKDVSHDELAQAIQNAYRGESTIKADVTQALLRVAGKSLTLPVQLSAREHDVLRLLVRGFSNPQIANELHLGDSTIKFHVSNILSKLGVTTRTEAAALAVQQHLVD